MINLDGNDIGETPVSNGLIFSNGQPAVPLFPICCNRAPNCDKTKHITHRLVDPRVSRSAMASIVGESKVC